MKKFFLASVALLIAAPAFAADLPPRPAPVPYRAPPPVVVYFSWTGFYLGAHVGGAWSGQNWTDSTIALNFNNGNNGAFIAGGQFGGNYQIGSFVIGAEVDGDWVANSNNTGNGVVIPNGNTVQLTSNNRWITTAAARFGVAIDRVLVYGKAGGGWVGNNGFTLNNTTTGASITGTNSNTASGWLVGAGVEWAFASNWTVKFEYDYLGLGNQTFTVPATAPFLAGDTFTTSGRSVQMAKFGINYLFGGGARY